MTDDMTDYPLDLIVQIKEDTALLYRSAIVQIKAKYIDLDHNRFYGVIILHRETGVPLGPQLFIVRPDQILYPVQDIHVDIAAVYDSPEKKPHD